MTGWNGTRGYLAPFRFTADDDSTILTLWREGHDTMVIASEMQLPESTVANRLPHVLQRARARRRVGCPVELRGVQPRMTEPELVFRMAPYDQRYDWYACGWMLIADLGEYHTDVWRAVMYWRPCQCKYVEPVKQ